MTQEELVNNWYPVIKSNRYKKFKKIWAKPVPAGIKLETITSSGLETINYSKEGDYMVENQTEAKERYFISEDTLNSRYQPSSAYKGDWREYIPTGEIFAIEWQGENTEIEAPWGQNQVLNKGDFLVSPIGKSPEVYRIDKQEMWETYIPVANTTSKGRWGGPTDIY